MGRDDDKRWNSKLRDMIINGAAKPSRIVSNRLTLDQAPGAFEKFDARRDGYIKVVLKPL
jgi:glutathione-independent formaldehyde dehydrogenase